MALLKAKLKLKKEQVALFSSWDHFHYIAEHTPGSVTTNAGYEDSPSSPELSRLQHVTLTPWDEARHDSFTFELALDYLSKQKPRMLVISFDEKSQIQALERAQPILPMDIGQPERQTHNYIRNGTLDLFAALNVATGEVVARCKQQHRAQDFVAFLRELDEHVEPGLEIHVVLDNLSTHKAPPVHRWMLRNPRFHLHFTPTYASWLNLVERFFGLLTEQALKRGSHTSIPQLRAAILAYIESHNEKSQPFKWTKTADEILDKLRRFGLRTQQVHG